ncbi:MAG: WD40 repeat domain-containing protein, partial [Saprospiraceae bacterium]
MKNLRLSFLPAILLTAGALLFSPRLGYAQQTNGYVQQTDCGTRYTDMLREADQAYTHRDYRKAYEKYRAARGCRNADAAYLDRRMDESMNAIGRLRTEAVANASEAHKARKEAEIEKQKAQIAARAAELTARAIDAERNGDKTLALRLVHEACKITQNGSLLPLKTRHYLLSDPTHPPIFAACTFTGHASSVRSVAFSPDGKQVLTGSYDKTAKLWNLSGRELQTFSGHVSYVRSVAFSPDGKQVLSGSDDKTAKLWNLPGRELQDFFTHASYVRSVAFSPDGKQILTGSD